MFLSPHNIWQRLAVFAIVVPSVKNVFVTTVFVLAGFLIAAYPCLPFDNVAGDWQDVVSGLIQLSILSDGCMHLPRKCSFRCQLPNKEQSGQCILEEISHNSKDSVLRMLVINSFDFSLNGLNSSVLFKSSIKESRFGCVSNCWVFFCEFLAIRLFFLDC